MLYNYKVPITDFGAKQLQTIWFLKNLEVWTLVINALCLPPHPPPPTMKIISLIKADWEMVTPCELPGYFKRTERRRRAPEFAYEMWWIIKDLGAQKNPPALLCSNPESEIAPWRDTGPFQKRLSSSPKRPPPPQEVRRKRQINQPSLASFSGLLKAWRRPPIMAPSALACFATLQLLGNWYWVPVFRCKGEVSCSRIQG